MRIGVDLGGTKIEMIALGDYGEVLARERVATPQGDYTGTVHAIANLVCSIEQKICAIGTDSALRKASVGIGIPGTESKATGRIKNANSTCLIGKPLRMDLEAALSRPVRLANDANCFALSEASDGAAANADVVFGVILGTGVGGGLVVRGQVIPGINGIAGEWGHNPMPEEKRRPICYCGRKGCIEQYLSGPGMTREHLQIYQEELTAKEIVAQAAAGNADCEATMCLYETRLARALGTVINVLDPDVIVLGGGLSNIERLYSNVPKQWGEFIFSDRVDTQLVRNMHGDSSGVRGAAWLWP